MIVWCPSPPLCAWAHTSSLQENRWQREADLIGSGFELQKFDLFNCRSRIGAN